MKTTTVVQAAVGNEGVSDDAQEMSIDEGSSVFLMDALGKLYSQPARAALREYLANGIDAHVEAGGKLPAIEVTLPSHDKRVLAIRDYGNGMSEENFSNILRRYGASTKRHSNKLTGGFGLGAKAGFALTDSFHMTSYQNGQRIKVRIFKIAGGKGFIEVIERSSTAERDGLLVEVDVPVGNLEELSYEKLVNDKFFAAYHDAEITVMAEDKVSRNGWGTSNYAMKQVPIEEVSLHNPENYETLEYGGSVIGWVGKHHARNTPVRAIVGRVSYEIKRDANNNGRAYSAYSANTYSEKFGPAMVNLNKFEREVILNLPIGSVDLPSSREEITYSERSLKTIVAVSSSLQLVVEENVQKVVNSKETGYEALCEVIGLHNDEFWKADNVIWRGKTFPLEKKAGSLSYNAKAEIYLYNKTTEVRKSLTEKMLTSGMPSELRHAHLNKNLKKVMITAKDKEEFGLALKKIRSNIADYQKSQETDKPVQVFLFHPDEPLAFWFENGEKLTLDEFIEVGKSFRAKKRAEAKALTQARSGNPAFKGKTGTELREVFWVPVTKEVASYNTVQLSAVEEVSLLENQKDFYYLSKAEVKDVSAELSNLFPVRRGVGGSSASIDPSYARLLPTLRSILGDDAKIVFVPATRNMDDFTTAYPNVPSIVPELKKRLKDEWDEVQNGKKTDTYYADLFWMFSGRNKVSLINEFFRHLTPGEAVSMNADLLEITSYMGPDTRTANARISILAGELMGTSFPSQVSDWMGVKIAAVGKRYPLLTMMSPVGQSWPELKVEMIRYLKTC